MRALKQGEPGSTNAGEGVDETHGGWVSITAPATFHKSNRASGQKAID